MDLRKNFDVLLRGRVARTVFGRGEEGLVILSSSSLPKTFFFRLINDLRHTDKESFTINMIKAIDDYNKRVIDDLKRNGFNKNGRFEKKNEKKGFQTNR